MVQIELTMGYRFGLLVAVLLTGTAVLWGWISRTWPVNKEQAAQRDAVEVDASPAPPRSQYRPSRATTEETMQELGQLENADEARWAERRRRMVEKQLASRDITDRRVLEAMGRVPRHKFVPLELVDEAYRDGPLPIGKAQTISQPYIVALMTQLARPHPDAVALDVGTGSGYQAAVLAELCKRVYSIEIVPQLAETARKRLARLGYENVTVRCGDGYQGWPEHAPYDLIIAAAAPDHIPEPLIRQLKPGGRLVIPVGTWSQNLWVVEKDEQGRVQRHKVAPVAFVPMTGKAQEPDA